MQQPAICGTTRVQFRFAMFTNAEPEGARIDVVVSGENVSQRSVCNCVALSVERKIETTHALLLVVRQHCQVRRYLRGAIKWNTPDMCLGPSKLRVAMDLLPVCAFRPTFGCVYHVQM